MTTRSAVSATVARAVAELPAVGMPEVMARAALQTRLEGKYLVPVDHIASLVAQMSGRFAALEIDRRRVFHYDSV